MHDYHKQALTNLVEELSPDPTFLAIITGGSVAQGIAKETSDVDVYLVVTDEAYEERKKDNRLSYYNNQICDYPGGYIDGKIINLRFLELAAERGSEPTRYSFTGSTAFFSRIPDLDRLLSRIPVYPESNRDKNLTDFFAQLYLYAYYFAGEAEKKNNPYLLSHSASNVVLFASRIILAHNRILFPCHKTLMTAVASAPEKPDQYVERVNELLAHPTHAKCVDLAKMILAFRDSGISFDQAVSLFVENNEWNWLEHPAPLQDR
ncbi:nucleotidyltransferase domain-containing protein [Cohnella boryungensis]|uniref:Nucleotidyltransferase domain-containing protein n=1 Tax=Cohnella boryungensis TaxID=768479 RepID=A0ABV8SH86_9BACL